MNKMSIHIIYNVYKYILNMNATQYFENHKQFNGRG